jgi:hypothetical protein
LHDHGKASFASRKIEDSRASPLPTRVRQLCSFHQPVAVFAAGSPDRVGSHPAKKKPGVAARLFAKLELPVD